MSYKAPTDLPQKVKDIWTPFPLDARIRCAIEDVRAYPLWAKQAAVAITLIEQPGKVPVNNPAGIMAFAPTDGWGWSKAAWVRAAVRPTCWANLTEGLSGKLAPFLGFASVKDSMQFICQQCYEDGGDHYDGEAYALHWFGIAPGHAMWESSVALFDRTLAQVAGGAWPLKRTDGYRDAGASA